jgi:hypothetical protein
MLVIDQAWHLPWTSLVRKILKPPWQRGDRILGVPLFTTCRFYLRNIWSIPRQRQIVSVVSVEITEDGQDISLSACALMTRWRRRISLMQQETACDHASNRLLTHAIWYTWIILNTSIAGFLGRSLKRSQFTPSCLNKIRSAIQANITVTLCVTRDSSRRAYDWVL